MMLKKDCVKKGTIQLNRHGEPRNVIDKLRRRFSIFKQYGMNPNRMNKKFALYTSILEKLGCSGTFPVTAALVYKHNDIIKRLINNGMEIAIHGYTHIDFTKLSKEEQFEQVKKSIQAFQDFQLPFSGFRSPYLRWNLDTIEAIEKAGFSYSSNRTLLWGVVESGNLSENQRAGYNRIIQFYGAQHVDEYLSLPRFVFGVLDIPVSLPDDEMLVERLRFTDSKQIGHIWNSMLNMSYKHGELFTLQLHPERITKCGQALENLLRCATSMKPKIWIATLSEVAEWWQKKNKFTIKIVKLNEKSSYLVEADCSDDAGLLAKNVDVHCDSQNWINEYQLINARRFQLKSPVCPFVGVSTHCSNDFVSFLRDNGYIVEISDNRSDYGLYFDESIPLRERELVEMIESSCAPMLRFWRWPCAAKSALCITGDIDSITLWDFVDRIWK